MNDPVNNLIERVIKTILSCQTEEQLDAALKYAQLAKRQYLNMAGWKLPAGQFGLDMVTLTYVKSLEIQRDKQNPSTI
jgi:hypothetical protein